MQLIEDATEGCWIGHRARMFTSEIGSVYSPPKPDRQSVKLPNPNKHVETVIDIGHSEAVCAAPITGASERERPGLTLNRRGGRCGVRRAASDASS